MKKCINKGATFLLSSTQKPFVIKILKSEDIYQVITATLHMICVGLSLAGQVANSSTVKRHPFDLGPMSENSDKLLFPLPWCSQWVCAQL